MVCKVTDETKFEENFPEVGGKSFLWVWEHKKEFVEFTLKMMETTGFFKSWQQYCQNKQ